jgi:hypothetical protein
MDTLTEIAIKYAIQVTRDLLISFSCQKIINNQTYPSFQQLSS